jgi:hypothetical protein
MIFTHQIYFVYSEFILALIITQTNHISNLLCFDVEFLFAEVPIYDGLEIVREHVRSAERPQDHQPSLIEHCVSFTVFRTPGKIILTSTRVAIMISIIPSARQNIYDSFRIESRSFHPEEIEMLVQIL